MRVLIVLVFLSVCYGSKGFKVIKKRGIFGEGLFLGGIQDLSTGIDLSSHEVPFQIDHELYSKNLETSKNAYGFDLGSTIYQHVTVTNNIGVPVFQPYIVPSENKIAVPIPHPIAVPVDKLYPVQIPKPYAVPIEKPYPVVSVPIKVPVKVPVAIPAPKSVSVSILKEVPYTVTKPVNVFKAAPVVKTPIVAIGSGSLGYTHLGNGAYALGSGSLGISGQAINKALASALKL